MADDLSAIRARAHDAELDNGLRYLSVSQLARRWGISQTTVRCIPLADLPYIEFGQGLKLRRRRFPIAAVEAYEREHTRGAQPKAGRRKVG